MFKKLLTFLLIGSTSCVQTGIFDSLKNAKQTTAACIKSRSRTTKIMGALGLGLSTAYIIWQMRRHSKQLPGWHEAAKTGDTSRLQQLLIEDTAGLLSTNNRGEMPAHHAVFGNKKESVDFFITTHTTMVQKLNAQLKPYSIKNDIYAYKDDSGNSMLDYAALQNNTELVKTLLDIKANDSFDSTRSSNVLPLSKKLCEIIIIHDNKILIKYLLDNTIPVEFKDSGLTGNNTGKTKAARKQLLDFMISKTIQYNSENIARYFIDSPDYFEDFLMESIKQKNVVMVMLSLIYYNRFWPPGKNLLVPSSYLNQEIYEILFYTSKSLSSKKNYNECLRTINKSTLNDPLDIKKHNCLFGRWFHCYRYQIVDYNTSQILHWLYKIYLKKGKLPLLTNRCDAKLVQLFQANFEAKEKLKNSGDSQTMIDYDLSFNYLTE